MHNTVYAIVKVYKPDGREEIVKLFAAETDAHEFKKSLTFSWEYSYKVREMEIQ